MARIIVTRPVGQADELLQRLRAAGHDVIHVPLIAVESLSDDPIDVTGYDWVVITSANGARELRRRMIGHPTRIAAIGRATADAFGGADLVPRVSTQEGLLEEIPRPAGRVLFAAAEDARRLLPEALEAETVSLYRTVRLEPPAFEGDLVVLASPSAAQALGRLALPLPAVTIGPETTRVARAAGIEVIAEARTHDTDGLVTAVMEALVPPS